jgi:hypothetical protein
MTVSMIANEFLRLYVFWQIRTILKTLNPRYINTCVHIHTDMCVQVPFNPFKGMFKNRFYPEDDRVGLRL